MNTALRNKLVLILFGATTACGAASNPQPASFEADASKPWLTVEDIERSGRAPVIRARDTVSSQGPLDGGSQLITISDLVRYHGHACDGLTVAAAGIAYGLSVLFPSGVVDRTDVVAATNASVCYGDVAAYLTGARARYKTLIIDTSLGDEWILCKTSSKQCVEIELNPGFKPSNLAPLEKELRGKGCDAELIEQVQKAQKQFAMAVLSEPPQRVFTVRRLEAFPYEPGDGRGDVQKARCNPVQGRSTNNIDDRY